MQNLAQILTTKAGLFRLPEQEMASLYEGGRALIPLGGEDGKSPLVQFQGRQRLPLNVVKTKLQKTQSSVYGLRLSGLTVVDIDRDDKANRAYVKKRFGHSPLSVQTPRGLHLYFTGETPNQAIRQNNIAVDIKSGANSYIVGPGSIRPDGGKYQLLAGNLNKLNDLPEFRDNFLKSISVNAGKVKEGERYHKVLFPKAIEFVECVDSLEQLILELRGQVQFDCENPDTVTEAEIIKVAKWAWEKRLSNELWAGAKSAVKTYHHEFNRLMAEKHGELGLTLLHVLRHNHSGKKRIGKPFPIARQAMVKADLIQGWKEKKYRLATASLLKSGIIRLVKRGGGNSGANLYQFATLLPTKRGEGFSLLTGPIGPSQISGNLRLLTGSNQSQSIGGAK